MACMYSNAESLRRYFGDSLQLTNWILDSGATFYRTPEISYFIPGSLVETDKYIEVADVNLVTAKQTGEIQMKICDDNGKPFISALYNELFAPKFSIYYFP